VIIRILLWLDKNTVKKFGPEKRCHKGKDGKPD
jgi:hypothetical protein